MAGSWLGSLQVALQDFSALGVMLGLGPERLDDGGVGHEAAQALGVEHGEGEVSFGVPVLSEDAGPGSQRLAFQRAELVGGGSGHEMPLGSQGQALQFGYSALQGVSGGHLAPAGVGHAADEALG